MVDLAGVQVAQHHAVVDASLRVARSEPCPSAAPAVLHRGVGRCRGFPAQQDGPRRGRRAAGPHRLLAVRQVRRSVGHAQRQAQLQRVLRHRDRVHRERAGPRGRKGKTAAEFLDRHRCAVHGRAGGRARRQRDSARAAAGDLRTVADEAHAGGGDALPHLQDLASAVRQPRAAREAGLDHPPALHGDIRGFPIGAHAPARAGPRGMRPQHDVLSRPVGHAAADGFVGRHRRASCGDRQRADLRRVRARRGRIQDHRERDRTRRPLHERHVGPIPGAGRCRDRAGVLLQRLPVLRQVGRAQARTRPLIGGDHAGVDVDRQLGRLKVAVPAVLVRAAVAFEDVVDDPVARLDQQHRPAVIDPEPLIGAADRGGIVESGQALPRREPAAVGQVRLALPIHHDRVGGAGLHGPAPELGRLVPVGGAAVGQVGAAVRPDRHRQQVGVRVDHVGGAVVVHDQVEVVGRPAAAHHQPAGVRQDERRPLRRLAPTRLEPAEVAPLGKQVRRFAEHRHHRVPGQASPALFVVVRHVAAAAAERGVAHRRVLALRREHEHRPLVHPLQGVGPLRRDRLACLAQRSPGDRVLQDRAEVVLATFPVAAVVEHAVAHVLREPLDGPLLPARRVPEPRQRVRELQQGDHHRHFPVVGDVPLGGGVQKLRVLDQQLEERRPVGVVQGARPADGPVQVEGDRHPARRHERLPGAVVAVPGHGALRRRPGVGVEGAHDVHGPACVAPAAGGAVGGDERVHPEPAHEARLRARIVPGVPVDACANVQHLADEGDPAAQDLLRVLHVA